MAERQIKQWQRLGKADPYWSVLTDPRMKDGGWDREAFFRTGEREIRRVMRQLKRLRLAPDRGVALDYGCGVGRLSRALSTHFEQVIGIDMSASMLEEARSANADMPAVRFVLNDGASLDAVVDGSVDLIYSNIALQHSPAETQRKVLAQMGRKLAPGGALVVQTPADYDRATWVGWLHRLAGNRVMNLFRHLRYGPAGVMEIHVLPRVEAEQALRATGLDLLAVLPDGSAGNGFVSWRYYAARPRD